MRLITKIHLLLQQRLVERKWVQQLGSSFFSLRWCNRLQFPSSSCSSSSSSSRLSPFPCSSSLVAAELPVRLLTYDFLNFPRPHILGLKLFLCSDNKNYFGCVSPAVSAHKVRPTVLISIVPRVFQNVPLPFSDGLQQFFFVVVFFPLDICQMNMTSQKISASRPNHRRRIKLLQYLCQSCCLSLKPSALK